MKNLLLATSLLTLSGSAAATPSDFDGANCRLNQYQGYNQQGQKCSLNLTLGRRAPRGGDVPGKCIENGKLSGNFIVGGEYFAKFRPGSSFDAVFAAIDASGCRLKKI